MLGVEESKVVADMATQVREGFKKALGGVDREILSEFVGELLDQELAATKADDETRAGAVIFLKHKIMRHGGDFRTCNKCLGT